MGKLRPILFSTDMVRAILEGRKTQTRRLNGLKYINEIPNAWFQVGIRETGRFWDSTKEACPNPLSIKYGFSKVARPSNSESVYINCPYGKPGDFLWVREAWRLTQPYGPEDYHFGYKSGDFSSWEASEKFDFSTPDIWKPSIHMPFEAARIFLRIKSVRVERLQDITEIDAFAEGIQTLEPNEAYYDYKKQAGSYATARGSFTSLWEKINGESSWNANPWVWVIEFERISKEEAMK